MTSSSCPYFKTRVTFNLICLYPPMNYSNSIWYIMLSIIQYSYEIRVYISLVTNIWKGFFFLNINDRMLVRSFDNLFVDFETRQLSTCQFLYCMVVMNSSTFVLTSSWYILEQCISWIACCKGIKPEPIFGKSFIFFRLCTLYWTPTHPSHPVHIIRQPLHYFWLVQHII